MKDVAKQYINNGWQVVPLIKGSKACKDDKWTKLIFKPEDFRDDDNIGIRSVHGLVDIDCDSPEVVEMASAFLPKTGAIYGRPNKPRAHWLYTSTCSKLVAYKDLGSSADKATLIEIRVNHQSMAPPSRHPDGQLLAWEGTCGEAAVVDGETLERAVRLVATAALLARHYNPPGNRHEWGLAIAGLFRQLDISEQEALALFKEAGKWARDNDIADRHASVRSTYGKPDDDPIVGSKLLIELMGQGKKFLASIRRIWGTSGGAFLLNGKDQIIANSQENIRRAFTKLQLELRFNVFSQKPFITFNNTTTFLDDAVRNRLWLTIDEKFGFRPTGDFFDVLLQDTARQSPYHPVLDYLNSLVWDKTPRLDTWLIDNANAEDHAYTRAISAVVLIAAVRRVRHPGSKFDELLVLQSGQGLLKSTALRALCPHDDWFSDDLPLNVDAKQIIERTSGKWIIEASDLSGMPRAQTEMLKSMLSRQIDGPVRLAYARLPVEQARQFIVIGTTNSHAYLRDATGNRRFWPLNVKNFNIAGIRHDRDQLWAEATTREHNGESTRLPEELYAHATVQQEQAFIDDSWEDPLRKQYAEDEDIRVTRDDVFNVLNIPIERRDVRVNERVISLMQRLGFRRMTIRQHGVPTKGWGRDAKIPF
jgi:hypothetical protein